MNNLVCNKCHKVMLRYEEVDLKSGREHGCEVYKLIGNIISSRNIYPKFIYKIGDIV